MNKFKFIVLTILIIISLQTTKAEYFLNFADFFTVYFDTIWADIPQSYKYIKLNFKNINQDSKVYPSLQKWVYMDLMSNQNINLHLNQKITQKQVSILIKSNFGIDIQYLSWWVTLDRLSDILSQLQQSNFQDINTQDQIMQHVYDTLQSNYLYKDAIQDDIITYWTIKWMVNSLNDPYTEFFTPDEAKEFNDDISWEFQWIWAYLEKTSNWEIIIVSPIQWSPADQAGIQAQDQIIKINDTSIDSDISIAQVVKMVKGPQWTSVKIKIKRWDQQLDFTIIREQITIQNIQSQILPNNYCYTAIHMFSFWIDKEFDTNMTKFKDCTKYIFDVRNNPGWWLYEVSDILWYFVPTWETTISIQDRYWIQDLKARNKPHKIDKNIIILINWWSASASEIFASTIKDYIPNTLLIWEKTFGKWSVQSIIDYTDWSMLKYTQSKRYTWKSQRNIDKQWINPDIKLIDNPSTQQDEVLDKIQNLNF